MQATTDKPLYHAPRIRSRSLRSAYEAIRGRTVHSRSAPPLADIIYSGFTSKEGERQPLTINVSELTRTLMQDTTDPWVGLNVGYEHYGVVLGGPIAIQRALNAFDLDAWKAQGPPIRRFSDLDPGRVSAARTVAAIYAIGHYAFGAPKRYRSDPKRLEGFRGENGQPLRPTSRLPVNPYVTDTFYLDSGMAVMVVSVHRPGTGPRSGDRWVVAQAERAPVFVRDEHVANQVEHEYGRRARRTRGHDGHWIVRPQTVEVWALDSRLDTDWDASEHDDAVAAARQWVSDMRMADGRPPLDAEVIVDPDIIYRAMIVTEENPLASAAEIIGLQEAE